MIIHIPKNVSIKNRTGSHNAAKLSFYTDFVVKIYKRAQHKILHVFQKILNFLFLLNCFLIYIGLSLSKKYTM